MHRRPHTATISRPRGVAHRAAGQVRRRCADRRAPRDAPRRRVRPMAHAGSRRSRSQHQDGTECGAHNRRRGNDCRSRLGGRGSRSTHHGWSDVAGPELLARRRGVNSQSLTDHPIGTEQEKRLRRRIASQRGRSPDRRVGCGERQRRDRPAEQTVRPHALVPTRPAMALPKSDRHPCRSHPLPGDGRRAGAAWIETKRTSLKPSAFAPVEVAW